MSTWIMIPTYNEAENIADLLRDLRREAPEAEILVVDDNSPDGTAALVRSAAESDPKVHLLLRTTDRGRGAAGRDGFKHALEQGAARVVEMDADYSHHPRYLPAILQASEDADIVLGSRYVAGGCETGRSAFRQFVSQFAGWYLRALLGVTVRDPSSGYRCFRREVLQALQLDRMVSTGPLIVSEVLYKARLQGFTMAEVPIRFEDRARGESKLNFLTLLKTLAGVARLRWMHLRGEF